MRRGLLALACAGGVVLQGAGALAESWTVLEGRLKVNGVSKRLTGSFDASLFEPDPPDGPTPVVVGLDDFAFAAGRRKLTPRVPVEYQGLTPVAWIELADQIQLEGDQVTFLRVRSGGKLVAESADEVTYRFFELRSDASDGGRAQGHLGDTALPRRLALKGDLYRVEQSFRLPGARCSQPPGTGGSPGGGGAVIGSGGAGGLVIGSGGAVVIGSGGTGGALIPSGAVISSSSAFGRRDFVWESRSEATLVQNHVVPLSSGAGTPYTSSSATMVSNFVRYYSLALDGPPSLEQLGIRAPSGAEVSADANGAVVVASTGDLFVEGVLPSGPISDLTSLKLTTPGRIVVTGSIDLPSSVSLYIEAGEIHIDTPDDLVPGEDYVVVVPNAPVGLPDFCQGLAPILPAEEELIGRFSLVASAARQVKIDVLPREKRNRVLPGSDVGIPVALLGSRSLDVLDVDPDSLRLGSGEAEPTGSVARTLPGRGPMNRDRHADLWAWFAPSEAEVAFGDTQLCLVAETRSGELLEGCDRIDARPELATPHR